ncbi:MAG TPA: glycosyltransferase family 4 protein, partial [Acidimicrobiales bacterium]|nr:glycosyltransferase family 4 protein [Acidimicrobiales bacterium]
MSKPGGVQGQVMGLARAMRDIGHSATVLAPIDGRSGVDRARVGPADGVVSLGRSLSVPANGSEAPLALSPSSAVRAVRAVRDGSFDLIHIHEPFAPIANYACLFWCKEPKVGTFHRSGAGAGYRFVGPLLRLAGSHLDARCAVSEAAVATAAEVIGGSYELISNGIDLDRFRGVDPWRTNGPMLGPTVLFVGRHEERKGLGVLLDAWSRLASSETFAIPSADASADPSAEAEVALPELWVSGEGPLTAGLQKRFARTPGVKWLGRLSDEELSSRLLAADVLCAPSLGGESFGVVLAEALAARTAVVASNLRGYADVVGSGAALVPPGDPVALARSLARALDDARLHTGSCAPEVLAQGVSRAERWSMKSVAARYVEVYERVLARRP